MATLGGKACAGSTRASVEISALKERQAEATRMLEAKRQAEAISGAVDVFVEWLVQSVEERAEPAALRARLAVPEPPLGAPGGSGWVGTPSEGRPGHCP